MTPEEEQDLYDKALSVLTKIDRLLDLFEYACREQLHAKTYANPN